MKKSEGVNLLGYHTVTYEIDYYSEFWVIKFVHRAQLPDGNDSFQPSSPKSGSRPWSVTRSQNCWFETIFAKLLQYPGLWLSQVKNSSYSDQWQEWGNKHNLDRSSEKVVCDSTLSPNRHRADFFLLLLLDSNATASTHRKGKEVGNS